jgi:hypothetical protein
MRDCGLRVSSVRFCLPLRYFAPMPELDAIEWVTAAVAVIFVVIVLVVGRWLRR